MFIKVVLPAPFSPSTPCTVPGSIVNETSLTARTLAKFFVMCWSSMVGMTNRLNWQFRARRLRDCQMIGPELFETSLHRKPRRPLESGPRHACSSRLIIQQLIDRRHPGGRIDAAQNSPAKL